MDFVVERLGWFCDWLYATIVRKAKLFLFVCVLAVFIFSVTLYAEFLPTKQRAKCVVLLDVSVCVKFCFCCAFVCF